MLVVSAGMPAFGDPRSPVHNALPERFVHEGPAETGAVNIVSAVVLDYRAYDTLGEATVLFAAVAATMGALAASGRKGGRFGG